MKTFSEFITSDSERIRINRDTIIDGILNDIGEDVKPNK